MPSRSIPRAAAAIPPSPIPPPCILCGADSTWIDIIQRLLPVGYWDLFRRKLLPKGK